jgi:hypothetical protein
MLVSYLKNVNFLTVGRFGRVVVTKLVLYILIGSGSIRVLSRAISGFPALSVDG